MFGNEDTEETAEVFSDLESFSYDYKIEFEVSKQFEVDTKLWRNSIILAEMKIAFKKGGADRGERVFS